MIRFLFFMVIISEVAIAKDSVTCSTDSKSLSIVNSTSIEQIQKIINQLPIVKGVNITKKDLSTDAWSEQWSAYIYNALDDPKFSSLMNKKINTENLKLLKCTNYNSFKPEEKKKFLIVFIAAIAEMESDFNINEKTGSNYGLLQMSSADAKFHSGEAASTEDLKNPIINLNRGLHILQKQLNKRNAQLFPAGKIFHWEVLSEGHRGAVINRFKNNLFNLPFCKG